MRTASLKLTYETKNITEATAPYVLNFGYTDHAHGKADDLQVTLEDSKGLWKNAWFPEKGAKLTAEIVCRNWVAPGKTSALKAGTFEIDEISVAGPPDTVSIKAVSALIATSLRREKKTRAWENTNLEAIAAEIAAGHGLTSFYEAGEAIEFVRVDQREESDLKFLQRLCDEHGLNLKVSEEKLILFEGKKYEEKASSFEIVRGAGWLKGFSFETKSHDIYRACQVAYWDPEAKEEKVYAYTPTDGPTVGQTLKINKRVKSLADAMKRSQAELRKKNKDEVKARLQLIGLTGMVAGLNCDISGFGVFDGKYFIEQASHTQDRGSGYQTGVDIRKVLAY